MIAVDTATAAATAAPIGAILAPQAAQIPRIEALYNAGQVNLIRATKAKGLNNDEFLRFIEFAKEVGLNPLNDTIIPKLLNENDPQKRQLSFYIKISGLRTMADRTGQYLAGSEEAKITRRTTAKNEASNPLGIVKATVKIKKWMGGSWHEVVGKANWDEFAPIVDGVIAKDSFWRKMPEHMIAKCAEAEALRRAFPAVFANTFEQAEYDKLAASLANIATTSEIEIGMRDGEPTLTIDWLDDQPLEAVKVSEFEDRVLEFVAENKILRPMMVQHFRERNRGQLQEFYRHDKAAHFNVRQQFEAIDELIRSARKGKKDGAPA
jgi:phage recombination protein Bet